MAYPIDTSVKPEVTGFFDPATNTISYVVKDPASDACAIIDSVMDIDYAAGRITYDHADAIIDLIRRARAARSSGSSRRTCTPTTCRPRPTSSSKLGGKLGIGAKITVVQETFGKIFNEGTEFQRDGSQFDRLFEDGDTYAIGGMTAFAHAHARPHAGLHDACDRRRRLRRRHAVHARRRLGARRLPRRRRRHALRLDPEGARAAPTRCGSSCATTTGPNGRDIRWETTVGEEKAHNIHVGKGTTREEFVAMREARDATLDMPKLIIPSLQVNMRAGELPPPDDSGKRFLKVPVNGL